MQQSMLEEFKNENVKELAPEGLSPVPGTELKENVIYISQVGQKVIFDIELRGRNRQSIGRIVDVLPGGRVLIKGNTGTSLYNRSLAEIEVKR